MAALNLPTPPSCPGFSEDSMLPDATIKAARYPVAAGVSQGTVTLAHLKGSTVIDSLPEFVDGLAHGDLLTETAVAMAKKQRVADAATFMPTHTTIKKIKINIRRPVAQAPPAPRKRAAKTKTASKKTTTPQSSHESSASSTSVDNRQITGLATPPLSDTSPSPPASPPPPSSSRPSARRIRKIKLRLNLKNNSSTACTTLKAPERVQEPTPSLSEPRTTSLTSGLRIRITVPPKRKMEDMDVVDDKEMPAAKKGWRS